MAPIRFSSLIVVISSMIALLNAATLNPIVRQSAQCRNRDIRVTNDIRLVVRYVWGRRQTDLDTSTRFLGENVGAFCEGGPQRYLTFGGDMTGAGEEERVTVEVGNALRDGAWSGTTCIVLKAQWFGDGPNEGNIRIRVEIRNKNTNALLGDRLQITARPGIGDDCSMRLVGMVVLDEEEGVYLVRANGCAN